MNNVPPKKLPGLMSGSAQAEGRNGPALLLAWVSAPNTEPLGTAVAAAAARIGTLLHETVSPTWWWLPNPLGVTAALGKISSGDGSPLSLRASLGICAGLPHPQQVLRAVTPGATQVLSFVIAATLCHPP